MRKSEMNLQYQGFHPSEEAQFYLESQMQELLAESPATSILQAVFTRQGPSFKGRVSIDCSGQHFFATATGTQMRNVVHRMMAQMRRRLGKWKDSHVQGQKIYEVPFKSSQYGELKEESNNVFASA